MSDSTIDQPAPELVTVPSVTTAVVRGRVSVDDLRNFFDASFSTLAQTLSSQGVTITGPAFGLYRDTADETVDLEVGFPTNGAVQPDGDVAPSSLPAGRVARLVHEGAFDGLGASWQRLRSWIDEQGLTPRPMSWEVYVTEPSPDMDPRELRTELNAPVDD
jgi:effector-binding domain-containing protein